MKGDGRRRPEKLLRWYPREWRARYGEEFLAMIEDTLEGRRPTLRLRMSVAWGGLRERSHLVRTGPTPKRLDGVFRLLLALLAGSAAARVSAAVRASPPPARAWLATAAQDALIAVFALAGVCILAGGVTALPAFGRFLRAGGWPRIRRGVVRAAAASVVAAGGLTWLILASRGQTYAQLAESWAYTLDFTASAGALAITLWLWGAMAIGAAKHLRLAPRVRAAEKMVAAVTVAAVLFMIPCQDLWDAAIQFSASQLFVGLALLVLACAVTRYTLTAAVRRSRRLWSKPAG